MPALFSSPSDNAAQAAQATSTASNAEIDKEIGYVDKSEGNLRNAIAGLGPNSYFNAPPTPGKVDPGNTTNFSASTPQNGAPAPMTPAAGQPSSNLFAAPREVPETNLFAAPQRRRAM